MIMTSARTARIAAIIAVLVPALLTVVMGIFAPQTAAIQWKVVAIVSIANPVTMATSALWEMPAPKVVVHPGILSPAMTETPAPTTAATP